MLNADLFGNKLPVINSDGWPPDYEEQFWQHYRHRRGKGAAMKKLALVRKTGISFGLILDAVDRYFADLDARNARNQWCPAPAHPATWLHQERWKDEYLPGESNGQRSASERAFDKARQAAIRERG